MKASEIFEERTEGMTEGPWTYMEGNYGQNQIEVLERNHRVCWVRDFTKKNAAGTCFLVNLRDALLEYIRRNEEIIERCEKCRREYDPAGEVSSIGVQLDLALDTLRERMEP